jgi:GAF domain-containing protein
MADMPVEGTLAPDAALEQLGKIRLADHSMRSLLAEVAGLARHSLFGHPETSVTLLTGDRPTTVVFTGELARDLDDSQYGRGHGPCLHAADRDEPVEITDMRTDDRWPDFGRAAVARGCLSSFSLPLPLHEGVSGALNMYGREPQHLSDADRRFAHRFASYAGVVAANMLVYESALDRARNLEAALDSRAVIDQAKGILMERFKCTPDQAFQALARASMESNTKLRDIAEQVVVTGDFPAPRPG